jgi:hypothetical protein
MQIALCVLKVFLTEHYQYSRYYNNDIVLDIFFKVVENFSV